MSFKILLLTIATFLLSQTVVAQTFHESWKIEGFGFWVYQKSKDQGSSLQLKHVWLLLDHKYRDNLSLKIILAPKGPPQIVHSLFIKWVNPTANVDYIRVGRMETPFGNGISAYRIDHNPTIIYSAIDAPVVARSNGFEGAGHVHKLKWTLGVFSGERLLGNIPATADNNVDFYLRLRDTISDNILIGASQRAGPVYAWGLDLVLQDSDHHLRAEFETVGSLGITQHSIMLIYELGWLNLLHRTEILESGIRWTPGFRIFLPHDCEIKANTILDPKVAPSYLAQLVLRW